MRTYCLILIFSCVIGFLSAQSLEPEVIGSSGDFFQGTNAQLSWTIGEMAVETHVGSNYTVTQGFHQSNITIIGVEEPLAGISVKVYPNPVPDELNIEVDHSGKAFQAALMDLTGKVLWAGELNGVFNKIDLSSFSSGTYLLQISDISTPFSNTYHIIKSN